MFRKFFFFTFFAFTSTIAWSESDKGVGPVSEFKLDSKLNDTLALKGKELFTTKCSACHKVEERYVGPALKGVTQRRSPEWVLNMILNPAEMLEKNDTAKELLGEYLVPMTFQNVTQEEAKAIYEYFRLYDTKGDSPKTDSKAKKNKKK